MQKIVNAALKAKGLGPKAKAKTIKIGLDAPRGQSLGSRTISLYVGLTDETIYPRSRAMIRLRHVYAA